MCPPKPLLHEDICGDKAGKTVSRGGSGSGDQEGSLNDKRKLWIGALLMAAGLGGVVNMKFLLLGTF